MLTTALISFREFLEAFLIMGIFWGLSRSLKLGRQKEIALAAAAGFTASFILVIVTFIFGDSARAVLTHEHAELLESYLQVFSGCFLVYVIFSLHKALHDNKMSVINDAASKLKQNAFDVSLFAIIFMFIFREGFEIALFTASTTLFSVFFQNVLGLVVGFIAASSIGIGTSVAYVKLPIKRVFQATEYLIIVLGAAMFQAGVTELMQQYWHITLSAILPLAMSFLPDTHTILGHALQTFTGIDRQFSLARLAIMVGYAAVVYQLFLKKSSIKADHEE